MGKKQISILIIAIIATAFITYLLIPTKTIINPHTITVADTGKVAQKEYRAALDERDKVLTENGWLKKLLKLAQEQKPVGGGVSNPTTSPIIETKPQPSGKDSTIKPPVLYAYDFPISATITKSKITFLTVNPYLRYYNQPYTKTYEYDRITSDFGFALIETKDPANLTGIVLKTDERFFSFDGITAGAGAMFPKHFYALLEMKFSMYERLHIAPRITSYPEVGIELKYDIVK
jgi:hypothetical protein